MEKDDLFLLAKQFEEISKTLYKVANGSPLKKKVVVKSKVIVNKPIPKAEEYQDKILKNPESFQKDFIWKEVMAVIKKVSNETGSLPSEEELCDLAVNAADQIYPYAIKKFGECDKITDEKAIHIATKHLKRVQKGKEDF